MTFPFVITATALTYAIDLFREASTVLLPMVEQIAALETMFAGVMVAFVFAKYMHFFFAPLVHKAAERITIEVEPAE